MELKSFLKFSGIVKLLSSRAGVSTGLALAQCVANWSVRHCQKLLARRIRCGYVHYSVKGSIWERTGNLVVRGGVGVGVGDVGAGAEVDQGSRWGPKV